MQHQPVEKGERILHPALLDLTQRLLVIAECGDIPLLLGPGGAMSATRRSSLCRI